MAKSAAEIISLEQLKALREAGFVVVHRIPTESMIKAGLSTGKWPEDRGVEREFHRMVAESIRLQNEGYHPRGCNAPLADGQYFSFCGETDMGQTAPALCTKCGGEFVVKD